MQQAVESERKGHTSGVAARRALASAASRIVALRGVLAIGALAIVLAWPAESFVPKVGLDPSWRTGLQLAHRDGISFGDQLVFTFGPLGYLLAPSALNRMTLVTSMLVVGALLFAMYGLMVRLLVRHGATTLWAALLAGIALVVLPMQSGATTEFFVVLIAASLIDALVSDLRVTRPLWALLALIAAFLTLGKVSTGVVMVGVLVVAALAASDRLAATGIVLGAYLVGTVGTWLMSGQDLGQLIPWTHLVISMMSGYGAAMSIEVPALAWEYPFLLILVGGSVGLIFHYRRALLSAARRAPARSIGVAVIAIMVVIFFVKQGYSRHDSHSAIFWFACMLMLLALAPWTALSPASRMFVGGIAVAFVLAASAVFGVNPIAMLDGGASLRAVSQEVSVLVSPSFQAEQLDDARTAAKAEYALPDAARAAIGDAPVAVDPWEITAAWAYDLRWQPSTVMQRYAAYTDALDRANEASLGRRDGPQVVLQGLGQTIDGRFGLLDSPRFMRRLLCSFHVAYSDESVQVVRSATDRCSPLVEVSRRRLVPGDALDLPSVDPESEALLVAIEPEVSLGDQLIATAFKPPSTTRLFLDDREYRLIDATAPTPGLLYVPTSSGWSDETRVNANPPRTLALSRPATVTVYRMTVGER